MFAEYHMKSSKLIFQILKGCVKVTKIQTKANRGFCLTCPLNTLTLSLQAPTHSHAHPILQRDLSDERSARNSESQRIDASSLIFQLMYA